MSGFIDETIRVINGDIVVGNHDSIVLLGVQPQNRIRECSKRISTMLLE